MSGPGEARPHPDKLVSDGAVVASRLYRSIQASLKREHGIRASGCPLLAQPPGPADWPIAFRQVQPRLSNAGAVRQSHRESRRLWRRYHLFSAASQYVAHWED
jgi:hypothetical protein